MVVGVGAARRATAKFTISLITPTVSALMSLLTELVLLALVTIKISLLAELGNGNA